MWLIDFVIMAPGGSICLISEKIIDINIKIIDINDYYYCIMVM